EQYIDAVHGINPEFFKSTVYVDVLNRNTLRVGDYGSDSLDQFVGHRSWLTVSKRYPSAFRIGIKRRTASMVFSTSGRACNWRPSWRQTMAPLWIFGSTRLTMDRASSLQSRPITVHITPMR